MAEEKEIPKYRITETCYHNDRIYEPKDQPKDDNGDPKPLYMEFTGHPSHYMEPANAAAKAMTAKFPPRAWFDPMTAMTDVSVVKTEDQQVQINELKKQLSAVQRQAI